MKALQVGRPDLLCLIKKILTRVWSSNPQAGASDFKGLPNSPRQVTVFLHRKRRQYMLHGSFNMGKGRVPLTQTETRSVR